MQELREWRKKKAREADCPPYRIVPTSVLELLASAPCRTVNELLEVRGVGPSTVERFGEELLEILTRYWESGEPGELTEPSADGESHPPPDDLNTNRSYYWTWRVLTSGFRPRECASIRRLELEDVYRDAISAYEHGLDVELGWLFTGEELAELEQGQRAADPDSNAPKEGVSSAEEIFSAEQWRAFRTLSGE